VFDTHALTVLDFRHHSFPGHGGVTGIFLLAESHASFHTWPEHCLICSDVFACGAVDLVALSETIANELPGEPLRNDLILRGVRSVLPDG
jgi:S-adenosylmethionine decarboxylase